MNKPGLIFVQDVKKYEKALQAIAKGIEVVAVSNHSSMKVTLFEDLLRAQPEVPIVVGMEGLKVEEAFGL